MLLLMLVVIGVLLVKVLPIFDDVYASLGGRLTGAAAGLLVLGRWLDRVMPALWLLLAAAAVLLAVVQGMARGMPLEEAVELASGLLDGLPRAQARCGDCRARLERGDGVGQAMRESGLLPAASCRLLELAQRGGSGDSAMERIAAGLREDSEAALEDRVSRVEPALVLVCSVLVGLILLSVMLPLMHIMSAIG